MTNTSRVITSHTKRFCEILVSLVLWLGKIPNVGLAPAFMITTLILSLRLRITEAGHLAVFHQNLSGDMAVPLKYIFLPTIYLKLRIRGFLVSLITSLNSKFRNYTLRIFQFLVYISNQRPQKFLSSEFQVNRR